MTAALGATAAALGALGLAGWLPGLRLLAAVSREWAPMAPSTGGALVLLGCAVVARACHPHRPVPRRAALAAAGFVMVLVALIGLDQVLGTDLEALLAAGDERLGVFPVGRMSPVTAILLVITASAIALETSRGEGSKVRLTAASALAAFVLASGGALVLGYWVDAPLLYGGGVIPVALTTAIALVALGGALLAATATGAGGRARYLPALLFAGIGTVLTLGAFAVQRSKVLAERAGWEPVEVAIVGLLLTAAVAAYLVAVARHAARMGAALDSLAKSEATLRGVIESTPVPMFVYDRETLHFLLVNPAAAARYGFSEEEFLRLRVTDLLPPDDLGRVLDLGVANRTASRRTAEWRHRTARGETIDVATSTQEMRFAGRDAVLVFAQDVTERVRARAATQRLATAVEQAAEAIVITDAEGTIQYVNPAFEAVSGFTAAEAVGANPRILKSGKQDRKFYEELWRTIRAGHVWTGRFVNRRKDGSIYEEEATISPIRDEEGRIVSFVAVKRDVTAELALQQQLVHAQRMDSIGRLAGGVAHDFNNLLQAMLSHTQLLRSLAGEPERVKAAAFELEKQVQRAASLTRQLLIFSRRETVKPERLDLNEVIRGATDFLRRLVRENVTFHVEIEDGALPVMADHAQLDQVLMNLVVNASDAMPHGGALTIRTGRDHDSVWCSVADTGHGIPDEIRERIFDPFFTTKSAGKGTGLGLSVVHGIMARHGGTIAVASALGRGSVFTVSLPRAASGDHAAVAGEGEREIGLTEGRGERVLIVEDEETARDALADTLSMLGYAVTSVGSGEDALLIRETAENLDLLLTDYLLPGMTGPALAAKLLPRWPRMKVILMSGYTGDDAVKTAVSDGSLRFLQKPFDIATLARELRAALAS